MKRLAASTLKKPAFLASLMFLTLATAAFAGPQPFRRPPPVTPPPGGGSSACQQCFANCQKAYQDNMKRCGSNLSCRELYQAEYDACCGECLADVC